MPRSEVGNKERNDPYAPSSNHAAARPSRKVRCVRILEGGSLLAATGFRLEAKPNAVFAKTSFNSKLLKFEVLVWHGEFSSRQRSHRRSHRPISCHLLLLHKTQILLG